MNVREAKEFLKFLSKSKTKSRKIEDLERHMKLKDNDFSLLWGELLDEGYVYFDGKILHLTPKGERFLKDDSWLKKQIITILISVGLSAIITFSSVWYAFYLQQSFQEPIEPTLKLYLPVEWNEKFPTLNAKNMVEGEGKGGSLTICMTNLGKTGAKDIAFYVEYDGIDSNLGRINSINGTSSECEFVYVRQSKCYHYGICNQSLIPNGLVKFKVVVNCQNCKIQKLNETIDVCIWHKDFEKECFY
jgi:hypothetical protein